MSRIDSYLDELFDHLVGTGEVGRRLLRESEDHLRAAASDAMTHGAGVDEAEILAVESFGSVEAVVRELRQPLTTRRALMTATSALSFCISAAAMVAGFSSVAFFAGSRGVLFARSSRVVCASDSAAMAPMSSCAHHGLASLILGFVLLLLGGTAMAIRTKAVRSRALPPAGARFTVGGIVLSLLAALAVAMDGGDPIVGGSGFWSSMHMLLAAALAALALAMMAARARYVLRSR